MNKSIKFVAFAAIVACPTPVPAHTGATGIVRKRMDAMKDVSAVMKEPGALGAAGKTCKSCHSEYRKP